MENKENKLIPWIIFIIYFFSSDLFKSNPPHLFLKLLIICLFTIIGIIFSCYLSLNQTETSNLINENDPSITFK